MESITQVRQNSVGTDSYGEPILVTTETELQAELGPKQLEPQR